MFSTTIYNNIFTSDAEGQDTAATYARSGQEDIALEWLGRFNMRLARHLAYLRVSQSAVDASLFFNDLIECKLVEISSSNIFCDADSDEITHETMQALSFILESSPDAEFEIVEEILREINATTPKGDALLLVRSVYL